MVLEARENAETAVEQTDAGSSETTSRVLAAMLDEAVYLMDQTSSIGSDFETGGQPCPLDQAVRLRLGARLARIGGWVLAQDARSFEIRRRASAELDRAMATALDQARAMGQHREISEQVDRLAARAVRLDSMINADAEAR